MLSGLRPAFSLLAAAFAPSMFCAFRHCAELRRHRRQWHSVNVRHVDKPKHGTKKQY
jgi:hypothetical protein